jgi:hypothetical protein
MCFFLLQVQMERCEALLPAVEAAILQTGAGAESEDEGRREMSAAISRLQEILQKVDNKQVKNILSLVRYERFQCFFKYFSHQVKFYFYIFWIITAQ